MPTPLDLTGRDFHRLHVEHLVTGTRRRSWYCSCRCGGFKIVETAKLTGEVVRSCGCLERESRSVRGRRHPRKNKTCRACGKVIPNAHGKTKWCSAACKARKGPRPLARKQCLWCKNWFDIGPERTAKADYCGADCRRKASSAQAYARKHGSPAAQAAAVETHLEGKR